LAGIQLGRDAGGRNMETEPRYGWRPGDQDVAGISRGPAWNRREKMHIPAGHRAGIWRRAGMGMPTGADADTTALRKASYVGTARRRRTISILPYLATSFSFSPGLY
jgi:hypothetical protein